MKRIEREERAVEMMARTEGILIEHPLLLEAEARMNVLVRMGERSVGREKHCMPLIAPSGCGKSTILRNYVRKLNSKRKDGEFPALYVSLKPTIGRKSLAQDVLTELARVSNLDTNPDEGNENDLLERTKVYLAQTCCKILIIDEFHHVLLSESAKNARAVGERIKWLLIEGPCPIVVSGTDKAEGPFRENAQLLRRAIPSVTLRKLSTSQKKDREWFAQFFSEYFATMERERIASNATSFITDGDVLRMLMQTADGVIGIGCKIVCHAVYEMALASRNTLREEDFQIACDKLLHLTPQVSNAFVEGVRGMKISAAA